MPSFLECLEKPLMNIAGKLGQQPHLNAIRDGVVGALPLVLIGSLFLLVAQPPVTGELLSRFNAFAVNGRPLVPQLLVTFRVLVGLIGLFVAFGVAHSLARRRDLDALSAGLLAAAAFLLINGIQIMVPPGAINAAKFLPTVNLGSSGMFLAIILGLLVPEVQRLAKKYHLEISMPAGVPPAVGRSFSALIPGLLVIVPLWVVVYLLGIDLFAAMNALISKPLEAASDTKSALPFIFMLVIILIDSVLWLLGVHAVAILAPMAAIWTANIVANGDAVVAGKTAQYLNTREALQFFIWAGGSGATIALPFLLLRARAQSLRAIAKVGAIPALFNINEPLIFGVPVVMNAMLVIPFMLAPIVALTTTFIAVHFGWVPVPALVVPWTLPGPVGAFLATKGAWSAALLSLVNIALAALIYWPFVHALDRRQAALETEGT